MTSKNTSKKEEKKPLEQMEELKKDIPDEVKEKLDKIKTKLDNFQKKVLEKFDKHVLGISLLPPKNIDREKERVKFEERRELNNEEIEKMKTAINILVLFDDTDSKKMYKEDLRNRIANITDKIAKEIDKNFVVESMLKSELIQSTFDARYEILDMVAISAPLYDPVEMLQAIKVTQIHKQMVLKKFEKYIVSYIAAGSFFRGDKISNDLDVFIVVDDTDVKRMPRAELKDKLRGIIIGQSFEANAIAKTDKKLHVQVYILTDFWDGMKDANPVFFTILRDGIPLYDRGVFMPWKLLLEMGRIKPSKEAIDMFMSSGEKIIERVKFRMKEMIESDIYWATISPCQAALMLYGVSPPTPKETLKLMEEIFVKREKLLEKKYVDILEEIIKLYKGIEHNTLKDISGKDIDRLLKNSQDLLTRIRKLFEQIEKKKEKEGIKEILENSNTVIRDALKIAEIDTNDIETGLKKLVDNGEIPDRFLRVYKEILKSISDFKRKKITSHEIENVKKESRKFIKGMVEYIQRKRGFEVERATIRIKYGEKFGEVILLDDVAFLIDDVEKREEVNKAKIEKDGKLSNINKSSLVEMEKHLSEKKIPNKVFIKEKIFESLKELFGKDVEILVSY